MAHASNPTASVGASVGDAPVPDPDDVGPDPRRTRQFALLLLFTVTGFAVQGMVPPSETQAVAVTALVGVSLMLAVRVSELPTWLFRAVVGLTVGALALSLAHVLTSDIGEATARVMNVALIAIAPPAVAIGVLRDIRSSGQVRLAAVMGVLALYMLIGMTFGFVYAVVDRLGDEPFFAEDDELTGSNALYFSFITLTTVGFGDLTARTDVGRTLSAFEALIGQVYLVTVVAALVGNLRRPARR
ncbi:MAG: two pore domain potassium channel family protein [Patulibacter sp.]|nr:two pore domain potassium channel family protein [Patulibacter sp.]